MNGGYVRVWNGLTHSLHYSLESITDFIQVKKIFSRTESISLLRIVCFFTTRASAKTEKSMTRYPTEKDRISISFLLFIIFNRVHSAQLSYIFSRSP